MAALNRYLVLGVGLRTIPALLLLLLIYTIFDVVELHTASATETGIFLKAYLFKIPSVISELLPLSVVIGVALELAALKSRGEWHAMAAMGLSPLSASVRCMIFPVLAGMALFLLTSYLAPYCLVHAETSLLHDQKTKGEKETRWLRHGVWLTEIDEKDEVITSVKHSSTDAAIEKYQRKTSPNGRTRWKRWRLDTGWEEIEKGGPNPPDFHSLKTIAPLGTLPGAALTSGELRTQCKALHEAGLSNDPLEAEWALRIVKTTAAFLIPLMTIWLNLRFGGDSAARHVGQGVLLTAIYWFFSAVLWNGVATGVWSKYWLVIGVPALFSAIAVATIVVLLNSSKTL